MAEPLNVHCFMHVPFEGPAVISNWVKKHKHVMEFTRFYKGDALPPTNSVDFLVIMGGPMKVFDYHIHPWMQEEIEWVTAFIETGKPVLGICLGAQIVAASLGAEVFPGEHKEIGWYNVNFLPCLGNYKICKDLPSTRKVFHWHGDTFGIPEGAVRIAESQAFANQGFMYNSTVLALQFHLEVTPSAVKDLLKHCRDELVAGTYIQKEKEILKATQFYSDNQKLMFRFLDYLSSLAG